MNYPKPHWRNFSRKSQNILAGEDRQPNEDINKRAEDAPPSIISVTTHRGGRRGRGIGRGFGSNLYGNGRESFGSPRNAVNNSLHPAQGSQRGRDGSGGRGRGKTWGGHPVINTGGNQRNIHADGSNSSDRWPKGILSKDQGWAGTRARSQREDTGSRADAASSSRLDPLNGSWSAASDVRQQENSASNMRKAPGVAETASHPKLGGGRAPSPHRMPPHRNVHEPHTHAPTNTRLHFHPRKRRKVQDETLLMDLPVECSSSPSPSDYDLQYPNFEDSTDDGSVVLSSPHSDHIDLGLASESAAALVPPHQAPLPHDKELHGKLPSTTYKDVGIQWIDPSSAKFHHPTESSQPSLISRTVPVPTTSLDTENVGVQWQGSINIVISLKRPINSALVSGDQTWHEPTESRFLKRQKLASEASKNASVSTPDTRHPMTAGVEIKVERRSPSVELIVAPTLSSPHVKIERRSPSPTKLGPVRNQVTEGSQWYHPMPAGCHKSNPNWMLNRRKWFDKESAVLVKKGLKLGRHFFRDDGMVIDWISSVPRWPGTLDPSSPFVSSTDKARKLSRATHTSSVITIRSESDVIDLTTDVDEPPRPNILNSGVNQESSITTEHASSSTTATSPYPFSPSLHPSPPISSPSRSDAKSYRPSSSARLSLQKSQLKTFVSTKRHPLPILPVMTPPLNSTTPTTASSSSVGLSYPKPRAVLPLLPVMTLSSKVARPAHSTKADTLATLPNEADSRDKDVPLSKGRIRKLVTASSSSAVGAATAPNEDDSSDENVPLSRKAAEEPPANPLSTSARNQKLHSRPHQTTPRAPLPSWTVLASPPPSPPSSSGGRSPPPQPPRLPQQERKKSWAPPIRSLFPPRSVPSDDKDEDELDDDSDEEVDFTFEHICAPARRRQCDQSMETQADVDPITDTSEGDMDAVEDLLRKHSDGLVENGPWVDNKSEEGEGPSAPETIWTLSDSEGG